ncbi:MAG TPA: DUF935 family protein [Verrucomicrobiae bacterium]|nr:DUF935 family protein [Verrucomicrobiae bacterium]
MAAKTLEKPKAMRTGPKRPAVAAPTSVSPSGKSTAELVRVNNRWRDNYNPLRGLIMAKVVQLLECGQRGDYADLQWLYRMVEKRYPVLRSLILRRRSALLKMDWDIKVVSQLPEGATAAMAEAQRKYLRSRYELIKNLKAAIKALGLAEFRGYAILNKHRYQGGKNDGAVRELHWLPQWNFVRDGMFGDWYWNPAATPGVTTPETTLGPENRINPEDFIIRECDMPVDEIGAIAFMRSNLVQKDWDAFAEIFGLPGCVVIMPPNIPAGKEDEYKAAAEKVAEGSSGAMPAGGDAKFPSSSVRGGAPFKEHLEWQEKDVVLAGTGGKLAILTAPTGLNSSQGKTQADAFEEIATAEANEISELFQEQFDVPEIEVQFPGQPILAYFQIASQDREDANAVTDRVSKLEQVGLQTDPGEVGDKVNLKLTRVAKPAAPAPGAPPPTDPAAAEPADGAAATIRNRAMRIVNAARASVVLDQMEKDQFFRALAQDMKPLHDRVARILAIQDPQIFTKALQDFYSELDQLKADIKADPATGRALEKINATEGANAAAAAAAARNP